MKGIQTEYIEMQDGRVNWNKWESLLGRLDAVGDEINRALNRTTRIEEPRSGARIARTLNVVVPGSTFDCRLRLTYQQPNRNPRYARPPQLGKYVCK